MWLCQILFERTSPFTPKSGLPCSSLTSASATTARSQFFDRLQSDLNISSIKTSTMITCSNSLCRECDAHSSAQVPTSHHVRYRAVPRTNRTLTTANTRNHSATSGTSEPPAFRPIASACTDVVTPDCFVLPPEWPPPARRATRSCLVC